jgi:Cu/Ag efflux protein CusF
MQKQTLSLILTAGISLAAATGALADTVTPVAGGATITEINGTVVVVNQETRQMTIRTPEGRFEVLDIPPEVKRIDQIKIGDKLQATQTEAVLVDIERGRNAGSIGSVEKTDVKPEPGTKPAGTITTKLKLFGKVLSVDRKTSHVTIQGPEQTVTLLVKDKAILDQLKKGDGVIATYVRTLTGKVTFQ